MNKAKQKQITDYFRSNIFEALSFYTAWKMLSHSKSKGVVSEKMAQRYVEIQNYHPQFFVSTERAFFISTIILILQPFDRHNDSHSLYKIDKDATEAFVFQNESVLDALRTLRNKVFAHRDSNLITTTNLIFPSVINMDKFFENLIEFYNKFTAIIDDSTTIFKNAVEIKYDIERLFMNLYRGETMRKKETEVEWDWPQDLKNASDIL